MDKSHKERIAFEVTVLLSVLALFCLITRLWPLLLLVIPGIIIAALRLLFLSAKRKGGGIAPAAPQPAPIRMDNEQDLIRIAFGVLQRRVTERVTSRYPFARWVWEMPNPMERFASGLPLTILLNRAGGFGKAAVQVHNLQFSRLVFDSLEMDNPDEPPMETDTDADFPADDEFDGEAWDEAPADYALAAFQWVEANLLALNDRCNDAIAGGQDVMLIPARELPDPGSWEQVCEELERNGFSEAHVQDDGISVTLPK